MSNRNKFGFAPVEPDAPKPRSRNVGPMGAAIRDTAESLTESTDAKGEQFMIDRCKFLVLQKQPRVQIIKHHY